jgi:hypothetical protein
VRRSRLTRRRRALVYADPLVHAALAAGVVAPLVGRSGRRPILAAVAAATLIDVDHAIAARSLRTQALVSLPARPRTHSLITALVAGGVAAAAAGPVYGWATAGALVSHLLHDAGDDAAPTPLLWPWAPARQIGRRRQLAGTAMLIATSWAVSRAGKAGADRNAASDVHGGGAAAHPRTA